MKLLKTILAVISIFVVCRICALYVSLGTYVFPIAPYWVTQLPPNPPSPKTKHGEFFFSLEYEIHGIKKSFEDSLICDFEGFEVIAVGAPKRRKWSEHYQNKAGREIFNLDENSDKNAKIILEDISPYQIHLGISSATYFMGDPDHQRIPELPFLHVFDSSTGHYKYPKESDQILFDVGFRVIDFYCDSPIENNF